MCKNENPFQGIIKTYNYRRMESVAFSANKYTQFLPLWKKKGGGEGEKVMDFFFFFCDFDFLNNYIFIYRKYRLSENIN